MPATPRNCWRCVEESRAGVSVAPAHRTVRSLSAECGRKIRGRRGPTAPGRPCRWSKRPATAPPSEPAESIENDGGTVPAQRDESSGHDASAAASPQMSAESSVHDVGATARIRWAAS